MHANTFTLLKILIATSLLISVGRARAESLKVDKPTPAVAQVWRASSRLGYAPDLQSARNLNSSGTTARQWALAQLDLAYQASRQPPVLSPQLAAINAPLDTLVRQFQAEREARLTRRAASASNAANAVLTPANPAAQPMAESFSRDMAQGAAAWRLMACSDPAVENPLLARMTEFWFNHFNVFVGKGPVRPFIGHYTLNAIRAHALGKFGDLLLVTAQHPAMLFYLDQAQSTRRGLNENYAREVMELHTLGLDQGYQQDDVRALARILSGWGVNLRDGQGFRFAARLHDTAEKFFLGRHYSDQGQAEGEDALRFLARHPATARRIARRLATYFIADKPPEAVVERLRQTFLSTQGDIRAVMQALIESPEFWAADNTLFKTPLDFACSALAVTGGIQEQRDVQQALGFLSQAGQPLQGWQTPDGYKTDADTWLAPEALTRRADFALALGQRKTLPDALLPFFSAATRARIAQEPLALRTGLLLASPDFMHK